MGLTAIRLNSDQTQHWYSLLQQRLKVYLHRLNGVYAIVARLAAYCTRSWHNTSNHQFCISSASQWKCHVGRSKSITKWTMTDSLSCDISWVCVFQCLAMVAVLDGCTVGTNWQLLSFLWDGRRLRGENGVWWKHNARLCKLYSPDVLNLISGLVVHEVPGGSARLVLGTVCSLTNTTHKLN